MTPIFRSRSGGNRFAQRGGFFLGLIVGLLMGLAVSLAVALYVTKVPVPFINKVPQRSAEQDAAQAEKNRNWDPNAALSGKAPVRAPASTASPVAPAPVTPAAGAKAPPAVAADTPAVTKKEVKAATVGADKASQVAEPVPLTYFVQAGAFSRSEDAEQQRANLALLGLAPKVTEREQAGRAVFRVRIGPFERKEEADAAKEKLNAAGIDAALVRVQR